MKFGEASFTDAQITQEEVRSVRNVASDVPVVVVTSAMTGIADQLTTIAKHQTSQTRTVIIELATMIGDRHREFVRSAMKAGALRDRTEEELTFLEQTLASFVLAIETPFQQWEHDLIVTYGSRFSALIVSRMLQEQGAESRCIFSSDFVRVGEQGTRTYVERYSTQKRVRSVLHPLTSSGVVPVIPAGFGGTADGRILRVADDELEDVLEEETAVMRSAFHQPLTMRM